MKELFKNTSKYDLIGSTVVAILGIVLIILGIVSDNFMAILVGFMDLFVVSMFYNYKIKEINLAQAASFQVEYMRLRAKQYYSPEKMTDYDKKAITFLSMLTGLSIDDNMLKEIDDNCLVKKDVVFNPEQILIEIKK